VSPSNILLTRRGHVKLADFGIARAAERQQKTATGTLKGKYGYMSPEQVVGDPVDRRSDVFSLAVVLSEMLTGRRLFAAANELDVLLMVRDAKLERFEKFGSHLDASLLALVKKGLSKSVSARFQSAREFGDALDEWLFDNRHRVGGSSVAAMVEELYADASRRKRQALDEAGRLAESGELPVPGAVRPVPRAESPADIDGIPVGSMRSTDSMPVISVEPTGEASEPAIGEGEDSGSIPIEIGDAVSGPVDSDSVPAPLEPGAEKSVRYPSIEEALSSVSPQALDPSALDFDDVPLPKASAARADTGKYFAIPSPEKLEAEPPGPVRPEIEGVADDSGDLEEVPPIAVLYRLTRARESGLLVVSAGAIRKEIYFRFGTPEFVSSNVAKELFGGYLVSKKMISEGELAMALAMMPHYGGKLGDTLVGLGLMRPLDVFRMLTGQVRDKLVDVCTWKKGTFAWYADRENPRDAFPLDLDAYEVLGAGAMALPKAQVDEWVEANAAARPRSAKVPDLTPEHFQIGEIGRKVYDKLTGTKTVRELSARYTDDVLRLRFLRVLMLLVLTGLASLERG
jgi:hypothetical protein